MPPQKRFNELFKFYRQREKFRPTDLKKSMDVSLAYVLRLEKGDAKPPQYERLKKLASLFKLSRPERLEFFTLAFYERLDAGDRELLNDIEDGSRIIKPFSSL